MQSICNTCRSIFTGEEVFTMLKGALGINQCDACALVASERVDAARRVNEEKSKADRRFAQWVNLCPLEYRTYTEGGNTVEEWLDKAVIQDSNRTAIARQDVLFDWEGDDSGRWLSGQTGGMKTRLAWRIARDAFDHGYSIRAFTAWSWQSEYQDAAGDFKAEEWMEKVCWEGLVFVDDIGKLAWTENATSAFFEMIERRTSNGRKILFTSNHTRADVGEIAGSKQSSGVNASEPLTRRLKDFCKAYLVVGPKSPLGTPPARTTPLVRKSLPEQGLRRIM